MAQRATIAIPFNYDESWIGGAYYIQNLVSSFNLLPSAVQPDVWLLAHQEHSFAFIRDASRYPRLNWVRPNLLRNVDGGISRRAKWLARLTPSIMKKKLEFDVVFPFPIDTEMKQTVCWIPDFQEKHLPHFFGAAELARRDAQHRHYIRNFSHIVFSSEAVRSDFHRFYPEAPTTSHVVRFAVFPPSRANLDSVEVRAKYGLTERYFYSPNQFWVHKNHVNVIEAVARAAARGIRVTMAFSGKEYDHRAPDHAQKLRKLAAERGIADQLRFLGFLPRDEQMLLLENAIAIVQPSLLEGWSTVIEDAKSVSQYVIASDLPVNREQIDRNVEFFEATNPEQLAAKLERYAASDPVRERIDYAAHQLEFAETFMDAVALVKQKKRAIRREHQPA